ncbi:MAG: glycosyltransferase family 2 protein [Flammeovirgaceae bacterium]|nr:MAG: glycosyltransferase family 2 protein [Flammeovirgaceae bacterium]
MNTAIVILNYNGEKLLQQFLPGVIRNSPHARIIVADNASTDNSVAMLQKDFPQVNLIKLDHNFGFCGGYNRALSQVEAKYYVLLNSDVEVTEGWLQPMLALLEQQPGVAAVQPKILSYHRKDHFEYAGAGGGCLDALGYPFCRGRLFNYTEKDEGQYNDIRPVFWASGACLVIRSEVYRQFSGLDEDFFAHMEEIDLCWKIHRSGRQVLYCGISAVYHVGGGTLSQSSPVKTYYNFRNGLNLLIHHLPGWRLVLTLPLRIGLDYLAAVKFLVEGNASHASSVLKAHFRVVTSLLNTVKKRRRLRQQLPYSIHNIYRGSVVLLYYLLGRKSIQLK